MKYVVKVKFKDFILASFISEGVNQDKVIEEVTKEAQVDELEGFEIVSIEPYIDVEVPNIVN